MSLFADNLLLGVANIVLCAKNPGFARRYWRDFGRLPNIANPQRYSERMLWRKLVDHNPQFVVFSDKLASKEFLQRRCPELPVPRTLWVGCSADEIPDELLNQNILVKANHGSGFNHHVRAGQCDRAVLRQKTERWLHSVYGVKGGEWGYSQVEAKLFVEAAVGDAEADLIEFNVRASNGRPILGSVIGKCKTPAQWVTYLDPEGHPTWAIDAPDGSPIKPLPAGLEVLEPYRRAVHFTKQLSVGVDYARFDFLWNGKDLFGGEITVYPAGGGADITNPSVNVMTLTGWDLLQSHFMKSRHGGWKQLYADALRRQWTRQTQ